MIKLIWAMDPNRVIGKNNSLPWKIKEELKHFLNSTKNHTVLIGRKTYESLPSPLLNRKIIVLTRNKNYKINDSSIICSNNLEAIINKYKNSEEILFVCGGSKIYKETLYAADELIITNIKKEYDGDTYFPEFDLTKFELIKKVEYIKFNIEYYRNKF